MHLVISPDILVYPARAKLLAEHKVITTINRNVDFLALFQDLLR